MKIQKILMALTLAASGTTHAQEHPACKDLDYHIEPNDSYLLRTIASSCRSRPVTNLYYSRAYHADLIAEGTALAGLITYSHEGSEIYFESYRMYMALLEQLAPIWYEDSAERAFFLNLEYERSSEIVRLRLRGYDHAADHLEREAVLR